MGAALFKPASRAALEPLDKRERRGKPVNRGRARNSVFQEEIAAKHGGVKQRQGGARGRDEEFVSAAGFARANKMA